MNPAQHLHARGQRLWLDTIRRDMLGDGTLRRYIDELALSGLTSNPTIFQKAFAGSELYDAEIRSKSVRGLSGEALFFELALEDLRQAADLFLDIHRRTRGVDGWVSLEVSPLLADDAAATTAAAASLHARAARPNLFIKIPGTAAGLAAIEESIFNGVPINVTLLFSREQYQAAAAAYLRAIERRLAAGRDPKVASVASLFVSRWDVAVHDRVEPRLRNRLGIAIAQRAYLAYRELLAAPRWRRLAAAGALPQRLLWASTGTKDPAAPDTLYVEALAAPDTIDTMPEPTLLALAAHGTVKQLMSADPAAAGEWEGVLDQFARAGIDHGRLAEELQREGTRAFDRSWSDLLAGLAAKSAQLQRAAAKEQGQEPP